MWYLFLCCIFILYSENVALPAQENNSKSTVKEAHNDKIKLTLPSEGGTLLASTPDLSLPKDKQLASLLALDAELEKPKESQTKARKGVDNSTDIHAIQNITKNLQDTTAASKTSIVTNSSHPVTSKILTKMSNNTNLAISKPTNSTAVPKKPQVLSYEALVNADKNIHDELKVLANPSSKTLMNVAKSQIPSPNEETIVKVYPSKANSHPGMIMPIVITILVVPMFAIVGYMALKRGQEAWKNRHYKRMDFLLDGMYND